MPPGQPEGPRQRPSTVTAAGIAQIVIFVLALVQAVVGLMMAGRVLDGLDDALNGQDFRGVDADTVRSVTSAFTYGAIIAAVIPPLLLAIFGLVHMTGRNWARIVSWVFAGLGVCCGALGFQSTGGQVNTTGSGNDETTKAINDAIRSVDIPGWVTPVQVTVTVVSLLLSIAVIILLALPPSNEYFRKPRTEPHGLPPMGLPAGSGKLES